MPYKSPILAIAALFAIPVLTWTNSASAQPPFPDSPYYQPLNQTTPPGVAGQWAGALGRADMTYFQPVLITLPGGGKVTFIDTARGYTQAYNSPAQAGLLVGPLYRVKISEMPKFPGVELYPSLELIDRLHPPASLKQQFPIPIELTEADIELAIKDQLVTKILYLEQPDLAAPIQQTSGIREENIPQNKNLLTEADLRGRPVMYLRIGGRIPAPQELMGNPAYPPAPLELTPQPTAAKQAAQQ